MKRLFIVGSPRAGTTFLADQLAVNPAIALSNPKEPLYFSQLDHDRLANEPIFNDDSDYDRCFQTAAGAGVLLDASTRYYASPLGLQRINQKYPDSLLVLLVRNPVHAVPSYHRELCRARHARWQNLEDAWRNRDGLANSVFDYRHMYDYRARLNTMLDIVERSRVLILSFDDVTDRTQDVLDLICSRLSIAPHAADPSADTNAHRHERFPWLLDAVLNPPPWAERQMVAARGWVRSIGLTAISNKVIYGQRTDSGPTPSLVAAQITEELAESYQAVVAMADRLGGTPCGRG